MNANACTISELIDTTADALDAPNTSPEYRASLIHGIESLEAKQEIVKNIQKDLNKSERCGANELEKITKEKDLWTNAFMGGIFAMYGIAATMTTASSGQSLCLSVLTSVTGFTMYAAAKAIIVNQESEMLEDSVTTGTYRCNSGPQRPGAAQAVQMIYDKAKQKIRKQLRLGD